MNKQAGSLQSRAGAQPVENIIYTSTRQGKGAISTVNIGGDADIGDMADVSDSSLTEMNTTYARRIKRGQVAICSAMKTLINIFALSEGLGEKVVNNFEVKLTPIITVEDNRRDELLQNKIRNVNDMLSLINGIESIDETTKLKMILEWLGSYLNQQDIVDILNERIKELEAMGETVDDENNPDAESHTTNQMSGGGFDSSRPSLDINVNDNSEDMEVEEPEVSNTEELETPEIAPQVDLAEIEGQDLI